MTLAAAAAHAAPDPADPPPATAPHGAIESPSAAPEPAQVSDEKLRQFAEAAAGVQKIQQEYAAKAQSLQKTTEDQIISSVEEAGMTVNEFTALVTRVQSDPALARRLDGLRSQEPTLESPEGTP
jgi:hypothetical protein